MKTMGFSVWTIFTSLVITAALAIAGSSVVHALGDTNPLTDLVDVR